jgi:adenine-specific DNA-methyltransferase
MLRAAKCNESVPTARRCREHLPASNNGARDTRRDSLAGRIQTLEVGPFRLVEIASLRGFGALQPAQPDNGWEEWLHPDFWRHLGQLAVEQAAVRDQAFAAFSERGAYPVAQINPNIPWPEIADQLKETVINRVIQHDLRIGERGRKRDQRLLEEVFRMACRYLGQSPNPATLAKEVHITLHTEVGPQRINRYIDFLDSSLLIRAIQPLERRLHPSGEDGLRYVYFHEDYPVGRLTAIWMDTAPATDMRYVVETNTKVVQRLMLACTSPGDLVLDPTCGSGTTALVAEQWGRRWITCDTSRVAVALARTRLMSAKYPYYLLSDSPEGLKKESELVGKLPPNIKTESDIKKGFLYKRVPHITLGSIANNPEIKEGMTRENIDAAIARHSDTELLYDQPYEDNKRIRVTGPFTVESLSPHRFLSADENGDGTVSEQEARQHHDFTTMILDNLKKAGVQNTRKTERLTFDRLESFAGTWLQATGEYTDKDGKTRRVAVCIGPEHGTVGPDLVKEAAKEAVQGVGFDLLVVCGFAFDPHVSEETKRYGKLAILPARMNPDLAMGDELLKKTGAGNLFMVFGEPDVEIRPVRSGVRKNAGDSSRALPSAATEQLVAEIKGVDIYDPTTGQIRNSSTDDIACWFIDTDYNGESFFVRHAYFTGAGDPYEKLKRALRADIDEAAWQTLYSIVSRPFDKPKTGKIAIKVINHYGDEVMKIYEV